MKFLLSTLMLALFLSCSSNEDNPTQTPEINIEEAKLSNFPLFGINPTKIEIVAPEITDNKEVKYGEINITVANGISLNDISTLITSKELNLSKFSVTPGNEVKVSYENKKMNVFTIKSTLGNKEALIHYNVHITEEQVAIPETLKITNFIFEKSKNLNLPNNIGISKRVEDSGIEKIYVFVPVGTDFGNLTPTITYEGTKLYYTQDGSIAPVDMNVEYPITDTSFDFKYPKHFILAVKDKNNVKLKTTMVIVDVKNPVKIETVAVVTPDVPKGTVPYFTNVTKWTNQGNHKIEYQKANTYKNIDPATPTNVITAQRSLPAGGLIPGESTDVNVRVNATSYPEGAYKTTVVFYSRIKDNKEVDDLLEPAELRISSKIIK